jgi:hypothetical protein
MRRRRRGVEKRDHPHRYTYSPEELTRVEQHSTMHHGALHLSRERGAEPCKKETSTMYHGVAALIPEERS